MMNIPRIFLLICLLIILNIFLQKKSIKTFNLKKFYLCLLIATVFTVLSLMISFTRISGTILQTQYGWPHFFLIVAHQDIIKNTAVDQSWWRGINYLYLAINYLFYLTIGLTMVNVWRSIRK